MPNSEDQVRDTPLTEPAQEAETAKVTAPRELGGREGPDPTRYGDWELRGRCIDF
jgi:hypothetical protein